MNDDVPDFTNAELAFAQKPTWELLRAWGVFKTCSIKPIVEKCDVLYGLALRGLGGTLVHGVVRRTFFAHFCAGEDTADITPRIHALKQQGVGSILDYAAEAHIAAASGGETPKKAEWQPEEGTVQAARVYTYMGEKEADENADVFERAVIAVKDTNPEGFAAIKISALGDPKLLENISTSLTEIRKFYRRMKTLDEPVDGQDNEFFQRAMTYDEFLKGWKTFFTGNEAAARASFERIDASNTGELDFMDWTYSLTARDIAKMVEGCRTQGPLFKSALSAHELELMDNMYNRTRRIIRLAKEKGVRIMIDAEWLAVQPCIDQMAINLQREFNTESPIVFNTYQCYLKRTYHEVKVDIARAQREGWAFGAKCVRGAYMVSERARAAELGIPDPVWPTYEETSACFDKVTCEIVDHIAEVWNTGKPCPEMMVASHNRHSVAMVVERMKSNGLPAACGVYFGQLLGMSDHITMTLGGKGYKAYKYVPYGPIDKVMPYLIRRTQENSTFLGSPGVQEERRMLSDECVRRLNPFKSISGQASPEAATASA